MKTTHSPLGNPWAMFRVPGSTPASYVSLLIRSRPYLLPHKKTASPQWRRPSANRKPTDQFTRRRLQRAALLRPRFRDSGQVRTRVHEFGERQTLIDSYLRRPDCEDLPCIFTCSPRRHSVPFNLSELVDPTDVCRTDATGVRSTARRQVTQE
jgi:hypothetical protein